MPPQPPTHPPRSSQPACLRPTRSPAPPPLTLLTPGHLGQLPRSRASRPVNSSSSWVWTWIAKSRLAFLGSSEPVLWTTSRSCQSKLLSRGRTLEPVVSSFDYEETMILWCADAGLNPAWSVALRFMRPPIHSSLRGTMMLLQVVSGSGVWHWLICSRSTLRLINFKFPGWMMDFLLPNSWLVLSLFTLFGPSFAGA